MSRTEIGQAPGWRHAIPLIAGLLLVAVLAFIVFHHFLLTFVVAFSVALLLEPLHAELVRRFRLRRGVAAGLLTVLCTVLLLIPVLSYGTLLAQQATSVFEWLRPRLEPAAFEAWWRDTQRKYPLLMAWVRQATGGTALSAASTVLSRFADGLNSLAQFLVTGLASALLDFLVFLLMVFFLLRDGPDLRDGLRGISPLTRGQESDLMLHLNRTVKGVLLTIAVVPLLQGLAAVLGFWIFGVPSPLLWGAMVAFAALIPVMGTPLAWIPAGLYLLFGGAVGQGVGMLLYGTFVISGIDNVAKPLILKGAAQIHTMLAFLSILGGLYSFGPKGLVVGPFVLSLVLSAYRIYRYDVLRWRSQGEMSLPPTPPAGISLLGR
jgi:predicted PurR-regulated permease PerM